MFLLNEMYGSTTMVFTRTCESTRCLALILQNLGLDVIPISGQMSEVMLGFSVKIAFYYSSCSIVLHFLSDIVF